MGLFDGIFGEIVGSAFSSAFKSRQQQEEMFNEKQMELNIQRETLLATADRRQMANPAQDKAIEAILNDYPDFDASYAISCVQTFMEMYADASKNRPRDNYESFAKLCDEKTVMKVKRLLGVRNIFWYEKSVSTPEITRYNPGLPNPHIMLKVRLQFTPEEKPNGQIYFICLSCFEGAFVCDHCGGIVEDKNASTCPYCDCTVTHEATERAWKITDVRKL